MLGTCFKAIGPNLQYGLDWENSVSIENMIGIGHIQSGHKGSKEVSEARANKRGKHVLPRGGQTMGD